MTARKHYTLEYLKTSDVWSWRMQSFSNVQHSTGYPTKHEAQESVREFREMLEKYFTVHEISNNT